MWSFGIASACALPYAAALRELLSCGRIYLAERDGIVGIADHIAFPVFEIQRGVDALLLQPHRFAPRSFGRCGSDHEVAPIAHIGSNHIKGTVVIAYCRRIYSKPRRCTFERQLAITVEHIAYLFPMNHVVAFEDGHTGKILERGINDIILIAYPAYRRIRVIAWYERVC